MLHGVVNDVCSGDYTENAQSV